MDRKSLIIVVVSLGILIGLWTASDRIFPPVPKPKAPPVATNPAPATAAGSNGARPAVSAASTVASAGSEMIPAAGPEKTLTVTNDDLLFHFTSHGGGLKFVELKGYPASVSAAGKKAGITNFASLGSQAAVPVMAVLGGEQIEGDNSYALSVNPAGNLVRAEKTLTNGLRIIKEFKIGTNYLFDTALRFENTSSKPISLPARNVVIGTASAMVAKDDPTLIGAYWYNGIKIEDIRQTWFANPTLGCFPGGTPRLEYVGGANNVVWAAIHNQFFTMVTIPMAPTNAPSVSIRHVALPPPPGTEGPSQLTNGFQTAFVYPTTVLEPGAASEQSYKIYAGPKEYNRLAQLGQKMGNNLDLVMGFSGFFGFFSKLLLLSMNGLHAIGLHYALAIIVITVIIKTLFWPLTNASTKSMKRMQLLQPQLKAIADKYKDDPAKKNQKTMEFMKEHKVNPLGGCLPMLLQIPVFFGFYRMLLSAIELRGVPFLWVADLSQPDTIFHIGGVGGFPINPLPVLMTITMIWQTGLTPPSPGMDATQQKMMRWGMPLMMLFFFYKMSAGLTLYWTVQNLLTIVQTKLTKTTDDVSGAPGKAGTALKKKK